MNMLGKGRRSNEMSAIKLSIYVRDLTSSDSGENGEDLWNQDKFELKHVHAYNLMTVENAFNLSGLIKFNSDHYLKVFSLFMK